MSQYTFELDISPEEFSDVEKAYAYYGLNVRDVIEILLKQSYILGDCPFHPVVEDVTAKYEKWEEDIPDIDWRDPEAVSKFMEED